MMVMQAFLSRDGIFGGIGLVLRPRGKGEGEGERGGVYDCGGEGGGVDGFVGEEYDVSKVLTDSPSSI